MRKLETEQQINHHNARVLLAAVSVALNEAIRDSLSPAALRRQLPNGKYTDSDAKYLENKGKAAIRESEKLCNFIEKRFFAKGVYELAYDELYQMYNIQREVINLFPEEKVKVLEFIKQIKENRNNHGN